VLPVWAPGTVATLCTTDEAGAPHAIPVSTALREDDRSVVFGLAASRASLAFLRARPAVALSVLDEDAAFTASGTATVVSEDAAGVVAVRIAVAAVADHRRPTFALEAPVAWRWTDDAAAARDAAVRAALGALGGP
jgi:hypothetical protein